MIVRYVLVVAGALVPLALVPEPVDAQSLRDRLRERAREQVERRVEQRAEEAVERSLDRTEDAIRCVVTDADCIRQAAQDGGDVVYTDTDGNVVAGPDAAGGSAVPGRVGEGAWANYDFVPGDRVLFAEDFSADRVGNFPRRLELVAGNLELVEWQGRRLLRSTGESGFTVPLPETLPERFTIEFDLYTGSFLNGGTLITEPQQNSYQVATYGGGSVFQFGRRSGHAGRGVPEALVATPEFQQGVVPVRIMVDGSYAKMFLNERRIANVPNAKIHRANRVQIWVEGRDDAPSLIGNLRIAAGGRPLYDALQADGRITTQGILFDTGSDRIRPESTPTLKEIGEMLRQHAGLRLRIEGHTDATGSADANLQLSQRRAEAVRRYLVGSYGLGADRLEALGKGQTEPADSNDTPEGRQNNRRVVLVRL